MLTRFKVILAALLCSQLSFAATLDDELKEIGGQTLQQFFDDGNQQFYGGETTEELDPETTVIIRLKSMDDFLTYVDLKRIHFSPNENGSASVFLAAPNISVGEGESTNYVSAYAAAAIGGTNPAAVTPAKAYPGVGYYFVGTEYGDPTQTIDSNPFDKGAKAVNGTTGHGSGYPCGTYGKAGETVPFNGYKGKTPSMNYKHFNADVVQMMIESNKSAEDAGMGTEFAFSYEQILQAIVKGTRVTSMDASNMSAIQTNCAPLDRDDPSNGTTYVEFDMNNLATHYDFMHFKSEGNYGGTQYYRWLPYAFDVPNYAGDWVQTFVIFKDYKLGDYKTRKADAIDVFGNSFGGHFVWERVKDEKATNTNSAWLIGLYNKYCESSGECKGYVSYE